MLSRDALWDIRRWNPIVEARLAYAYAVVYTGLGDVEKAFEWLGKAFDEKAPQLIKLKVSPEWESIRGDARFVELVRRVGLEE